MTRFIGRAEVKVPGISGEQLYQRITNELHAWGGMDHSSEPDENGWAGCSFDSGKADAGRVGILDWCDKHWPEYSVTFHRWGDE